MFVQNAKELLEEGGMHKDILTQSIRDCPILNSNINKEIVQMPLTNLTATILLLQLPPHPGNIGKCINIIQKTPFAPFNNSGSSLKKPNKSVVTMDEGEKEDFLNNTLEKMSISIERLEKLFFEKLCIPRKNIENMLSHIIIAALTMHDPVKFIQDKFTYYNRQYYSARMIKYVAKSYEMDYFAATEYLKSVIGQVFV